MKIVSSQSQRIAYVVTGHVQGVAFRAHTRESARALGITGYVENRGDGAVVGEAQGEPGRLAEFVAFLRRGSPWSRVERVVTDEVGVRTDEERFEVRR